MGKLPHIYRNIGLFFFKLKDRTESSYRRQYSYHYEWIRYAYGLSSYFGEVSIQLNNELHRTPLYSSYLDSFMDDIPF